MARTQAPDYDERREAIVVAGAALFAREGFDGTSVSALAKRCKTSKSLIYHYFASKEDILYEVMISHVRALDAAARAVMAEKIAPDRRLRELTHRFMSLYVGAADRHKVLLNDLHRLPKGRRNEIVEVQRGLIELARTLFVELAPSLKRKRAQSVALAMLYFGAINWTHTWFDPGKAVSAGALAEMAVDMTLGGLPRAAE